MNFNVCAVWATGKEKNSLLNYATFEGDIFMGKKKIDFLDIVTQVSEKI